jgi:PDZ domain-containing protein
MSRRSVSSVLACVLLVLLFTVAAFLPVPYVTMSPGPTVDVLSERDGEEIVQVEGHRTYDTDGSLELTTVSVTGPAQKLSLAEALAAWFDRTRAVYPRDVIYEPEKSEADVQTESSVQMVSSQDTAIAVALRELGFEFPVVTEVLAVNDGAPADGELETRDKIISVNGTRISNATAVSEAVQKSGVGGRATFVVRRDGRTRTVTVSPEAAEGDPDRAVVGIVVGEDRFSFSPEFLTDVLLGFQTIESTADSMLEAASRTVDLVEELGEPEGSMTDAEALERLADARGFVDPVLAWRELNAAR